MVFFFFAFKIRGLACSFFWRGILPKCLEVIYPNWIDKQKFLPSWHAGRYPMTNPWNWYIYPHEWLILMLFMCEYTLPETNSSHLSNRMVGRINFLLGWLPGRCEVLVPMDPSCVKISFVSFFCPLDLILSNRKMNDWFIWSLIYRCTIKHTKNSTISVENMFNPVLSC